ncbi:MAG: alginate export family protein [Candidatus Babeliales bacterium]
MSKKLILVMVFALVLAFSCAAYAEVQNVKVGGDISIWAFDRNTFNFQDVKNPASPSVDGNGLAQIANIKIAADLTDSVAANIVLRNERLWGVANRNGGNGSAGDSDIYLAAGYVTLKEMFEQPFTLKAGTMGVRLGSGLLVGDADTNRVTTGPFNFELADLSPRKAFTGFVGILDLKPITITGAALKVTEGTTTVANDDVNAYAINVGYDLAEVGMQSGIGEVYWVERAGRDANSGNTPVDNYGIRIQASPVENFNAGAEFCYQRSKIAIANVAGYEAARTGGDSNTAILLNAGYTMPDVVMAPAFSVDYTRLSKNWNAMMEDMTPADIANVLFPNTNVQCVGVTVAAKPMTDVGASLRYASFRAVKEVPNGAFTSNWKATPYTTQDNRNLGQELDLHLTYDYSEDVQFGLMGGIFMPGSAFGPDNREDATQVIGSMKVTF